MTSLLGSSPSAGFEAPLALLRACHQRIAAQCATLQRLPGHLAAHGADADAQQAAARILRYFDTAGHHHHEDEECDLLPALRQAASGSEARRLVEMTDRVAREHRELDAVWQTLRTQLAGIAAGNAAALLADCVNGFIALNERHIAFENGEILPLAERCLDAARLRAIGESMRARRGV